MTWTQGIQNAYSVGALEVITNRLGEYGLADDAELKQISTKKYEGMRSMRGLSDVRFYGVHQNRGAACAATPVSPSSETTKSLRRAGRSDPIGVYQWLPNSTREGDGEAGGAATLLGWVTKAKVGRICVSGVGGMVVKSCLKYHVELRQTEK